MEKKISCFLPYEIGKEERESYFFLKKGFIRGSCGSVYPYPVVEKISDKKQTKGIMHCLSRMNTSR